MNKECWSIFLLTFLFGMIISIKGLNAQERRVYKAGRVNGEVPVIDGKTDEAGWNEKGWEGGFIQREPYDGKAPTQLTEFKIIYDDEALYVAIRAYDTEPDKIEKRLSRRDEMEGDLVVIQFDSYFDRRSAFSFMVNASGVKIDYVISNDEEDDMTWDPVWYVKTSADSLGWLAEMKIPYTQLRFAKAEQYRWGLQVGRILFRNDELSLWQPIPMDAPGWVSQFGDLNGIDGVKPKREVELLPYIMGKMEGYDKEEGNPYADGRDYGFNAGLDGKVAVTNNLTMNFTINPDFGQVEADPSVVNLTAFETFYSERRPFFVEGTNIYNYQLTGGSSSISQDNLFYSRRIGRQPQYEPEVTDGEYLKMPENTTILGAFKLSGKTHDGWSVGIMESVTQEEKALLSSNEVEKKVTVEPWSNYFNARLQKDFKQGKTILGGMFTATNRFIQDSTLDFLPASAYTGGLDFTNYWKDKNYYLNLKGAFSHVSGTSEAITELQESPVHYYQRPDIVHVKLDTARTSLSGYGGTAEFGKQGGGHWRFMGRVAWRSPGLELNDMGYIRQADIIQQVLWGGYEIWEPFGIFRSMEIIADQYSGWDFGGNFIYLGGEYNLNMEFKNYWSFSIGGELQGEAVDRYNLRGGPAIKTTFGGSSWGYFQSDSRKKFIGELMAIYYKGNYDNAELTRFELDLTYRPFKALQLAIETAYEFGHDRLQYVETIDDVPGNRYIMARIDNQSISTNIRINYSITPDLTIQYWGQPFVFAGKYTEFKKATETMSSYYYDRFHTFNSDEIVYDEINEVYHVLEPGDEGIEYSFGKPDFKVFEFRSNLVVRWEYIPGSAVYLVWSQGRVGDETTGEPDFGKDMDALFDIEPHNVFLVKFTYRISL
jgi:hypothetical protein